MSFVWCSSTATVQRSRSRAFQSKVSKINIFFLSQFSLAVFDRQIMMKTLFACNDDDDDEEDDGRSMSVFSCRQRPLTLLGGFCRDLQINNCPPLSRVAHCHHHQQCRHRRHRGHVSLLIMRLPPAPHCWLQAARLSWIIMFCHIYKTTMALGDTAWQTNLSNSKWKKKVSAYTLFYMDVQEKQERPPLAAISGWQPPAGSQFVLVEQAAKN